MPPFFNNILKLEMQPGDYDLTQGANQFTVLDRNCHICHKDFAVAVASRKFFMWIDGSSLLSVWPMLTADERSVIETGTHGHCYRNWVAEIQSNDLSR